MRYLTLALAQDSQSVSHRRIQSSTFTHTLSGYFVK